MKNTIFVWLIVLLAVQMSLAQVWKPTSSSFGFTTKMLGIKVEGKFKGFQGIINFDPNELQNATISGTVEAATIDTDNSLRNTHLKEKSDFFEVVKFPKLKMSSAKIEKSAEGYIGNFNLTIKSITKTLKIPFTVNINNEKAVFKGSAKINRKDWNLGGNTFGMSNDVNINLLINAIKQ
ncbi:MAG: YceI family protein [Bacteroidota bacterium]